MPPSEPGQAPPTIHINLAGPAARQALALILAVHEEMPPGAEPHHILAAAFTHARNAFIAHARGYPPSVYLAAAAAFTAAEIRAQTEVMMARCFLPPEYAAMGAAQITDRFAALLAENLVAAAPGPITGPVTGEAPGSGPPKRSAS